MTELSYQFHRFTSLMQFHACHIRRILYKLVIITSQIMNTLTIKLHKLDQKACFPTLWSFDLGMQTYIHQKSISAYVGLQIR